MRDLRAGAVRQMTRDEVELKLRDLKEELFTLRFRNAVRQLDNPLRVRQVRRAIARLETILAEDVRGVRSLAGAQPAGR